MIDLNPKLGDLTEAEQAAIEFVDQADGATHGLGMGKWGVLQARITQAAMSADKPAAIWENYVSGLRGLGEASLVNAATIEVVAVLNVPGVQEELIDHTATAILRLRANREMEKQQ